MRNFWRVVWIALHYRWRYGLAVCCAIIGAILFGGNFGALFPGMKVLLHEQTLQDVMRDMVDKRARDVAELEAKISAITQPAAQTAAPDAAAPTPTDPNHLEYLRFNLQEKQLRLKTYQQVEKWVDQYLPRDRYRALVCVLLVLMGVFVLNSAFDFANDVLVQSVTELSMMRLRNDFYHHVMRMELSSFTHQGTGDLMARFTNDMKSLTMGIELLLGKTVREPLKAVACVGFACWLNWRLTLLALGLVPAATILIVMIGVTLKRAARRSLESAASIYHVLQETFQGMKVVKAFTMEPYERLRFYRQTRSLYRRLMRVAWIDAIANPVLSFVAVSTVIIAVLAGSYLVITKQTHLFGVRLATGPMDAESLLLLYAFLIGVGDPVRKLSNVYAKLQKSAASADRIFAFLDSKPAIMTPLGAPRLARHRRSIEFDGVEFGYSDDLPVLRDIDLQVSFGETIALVGPNGCGKTSLVNLLPRFYDPQRGRILVDGVDIRDVQRRSLRQQFGIVTQETILFNDSVYRNIAYGNPRANREQIVAAAKKAHAHRFIEELPEGYETVVGERALKLSGGQRQRIALARAILRDPAILILDEATSALDVESESLIHKVLTEFLRGRTTFLITHRLASLQLASRVIVMEAGRIEDQGQHDELVRRCGLYKRLYEIHMAG